MNTEQWERTKQLLEEALRLRPTERAAFLDTACGPDRELRAEVESLIAAGEEAGSHFLEVAAAEVLHLSSDGERPRPAGKLVGPYRLIQEIGRGGMGQVWLAEQTSPVRRQVALKLIRGGFFDDELLKRFQWERQSLALMDHPSIAKIFDAGATPEGQPYFVMEFVPGLPITEYCDQKRVNVPDRLRLFIQVCEAVQHAHQKAILHRDLKPANVLVQEIDGKPVPRIIDFGLAKALGAQPAGESLHTRLGSFVGTPGYMSPEQCGLESADVDTRSDVYSLGVLLYVLLTGSLPFERRDKRPSVEEILRLVREEDPPRPSARVITERKTSSAKAQARGTAPQELARLLRGDLDCILGKALERERIRRYGSAAELAEDLKRFLNNEPVTARPAGLGYRLRKYVRRHRMAVAGAAAVVVLLIAAGIMQSVELRRIRRERDRSDRIADFMTGIFRVADPGERTGRAVTASDILDTASNDIETGLARDPELQSRMMFVMGHAYMNLGLYGRSQSLLRRGMAVSDSAGIKPDRAYFRGMHDLAWDLLQEGNMAETDRLQAGMLEQETRVLGPQDPETIATVALIAYTACEEGDCGKAVRLNREVLEKQTRTLGPEAYATLVTKDNLAIALGKSGHAAESAQLLKENWETRRRVLGPENLVTIDSMVNLADAERELGRDEEARKLFTQALDIEQRVLPPNQPELAGTRYDYACLLAREGKYDEALALLQQAVDHGLPPLTALGLEKEPYFQSLRRDPRFLALVAHAKEVAAAQMHP